MCVTWQSCEFQIIYKVIRIERASYVQYPPVYSGTDVAVVVVATNRRVIEEKEEEEEEDCGENEEPNIMATWSQVFFL